MKPTPLFLSFAAVVALLGAGCGSTRVNTVEPAQSSAQRQMVSDKRVLSDQSLNNRVRIVGLNTSTGPEGFLRVQLEVQNLTRRPARFTYRVEWFDENAMLIELPAANATPRVIESQEILTVGAVAPTPRAKDFRIKLLEPTN
jgi:uncharacterized protein YcfL